MSAIVSALRAGDRGAVDHLWGRYFARMVTLARSRLWGAPLPAADEEDVALSAFLSFFRGAADPGRPPPMNRAQLWRMLAAITANKAADAVTREGRVKRGGRLDRAADADLAGVASAAPPPEAVAAAADEFRRLLDGLGDPDLQAVAVLRMEGYTTAEIARQLGCVPRTVDRRLRVIRCLLAEGGKP